MITKDNDATSPALDIEEIKDFYDSVYYADAKNQESSLRAHYLRLFHRLPIKADSKILDVACGAGGWLKICEEKGASVSGVDLSSKAIALCKKMIPNGSFHAQPAETLPFDDDGFDVVTCLGSLEHFIDPESSLREMVRVAKRDATFVILVPNKDFLTRKLGLFSGTYQVDAKEVVRTLDEWNSLFVSSGLSVNERWKDLHVINRSWITRGSIYTWPIRALQAVLLIVWPLKWQYQVYHRCEAKNRLATDDS